MAKYNEPTVELYKDISFKAAILFASSLFLLIIPPIGIILLTVYFPCMIAFTSSLIISHAIMIGPQTLFASEWH